MLIQRAPDVYEKLQILGGMAGDDVLAPSPRGGSGGGYGGGGQGSGGHCRTEPGFASGPGRIAENVGLWGGKGYFIGPCPKKRRLAPLPIPPSRITIQAA